MSQDTGRKRFESEPDLTSYAGRWVAVVRGRVVGVGVEQAQAYRAAKRARPKDEPQLLFISSTGEPQPQPPPDPPELTGVSLLSTVVRVLQTQAAKVYLVGGAVRDQMLGRTAESGLTDLDFATAGDGLALARLVANALGGAYYPLDAERGTGRVVLHQPDQPTIYLDFAAFRGRSLAEDLTGRDFTINAMALDLSHDPPRLHDPLDGRVDLAAGLVRATSPRAIMDDPIRTMRAVRQAAELDFTIDASTETLIRSGATDLPQVSAERVRDELMKSMASPRPAEAIANLHRLELLPYVLPEVAALVGVTQGPPHHLPVFEHTLATVQAWSGGPLDLAAGVAPAVVEPVETYLASQVDGGFAYRVLITLAALLHDVGKPATRAVGEDGAIRFVGHEAVGSKLARARLRRLRFSGEATSFVTAIVAHHLRPLLLAKNGQLSRRAIYRYFRATGQAAVAVALLALADHRATYAPGQGEEAGRALASVVKTLCQAYFEDRDVVRPQPLLTGRELMRELGLSEGPFIGQLLNELVEAQVAGEVRDRAQALAFLSRRLRLKTDFVDKE